MANGVQSLYEVGPKRASDDDVIIGRVGNQGELITGEMTGKHFEQTLRGKMFNYTIASQALVLSATTGGCPTVINPRGSGYLFVPVKLTVSFISGTTVIGAVVIGTTTGVGAVATGTGSPILTATTVAATSAFKGGGNISNMLWSPTTNTFTAAPTIDEATCINLGAAAPTAGGNAYSHYFDGMTVYGPGSAMSICYTVTTSTALFAITLKGLEIPLPLNA